MLLSKLCLYILQKWRSEAVPSNTTSGDVFHVLRCLLKGGYTFYRRRWSIRDPKKPDKFWPVGAFKTGIVEAMARLLSLEMDSLYRLVSREYGVARGARSFFSHVNRWPEMSFLVKFSIVQCSSGIDHHLLGEFLRKHLGEVNSGFLDLVMRFLARRGKNCRLNSISLSKDTSFSQVIAQVSLFRLDKIFEEVRDFSEESERPVKVHYVRYAGTVLLGIPRINNFFYEARAKEHFRSILKKAFGAFGLDFTWEEISADALFVFAGGKAMFYVLGLQVYIKECGRIKVKIPYKKWEQRLSTGRLLEELRGRLVRFTMANFLGLLNEHVEAFLHISFQYPLSPKKVIRLYRFFYSLVISRCRQTGFEESGVPGLNISQVQDNYVATLIEKFQRIEGDKINDVLGSREGAERLN